MVRATIDRVVPEGASPREAVPSSTPTVEQGR
jgi:hypothetical protein